jgi:hypothetical protein
MRKIGRKPSKKEQKKGVEKIAIRHALGLKKINLEEVECEAEQCVVEAKIGRNAA